MFSLFFVSRNVLISLISIVICSLFRNVFFNLHVFVFFIVCCFFFFFLESISSMIVLLPGKSLGCRSLVGCSPWGSQESDTTEQLHFHFSLSCIGEGNGNPLQCSCLENPGNRGAWWASVYGVAQSRTRLKRLSSSSSIIVLWSEKILDIISISLNVLRFDL